MKRNIFLIILGTLALVGAVLWAAFFRRDEGLPGLSVEERRIQREIDKANHCEEATDCAQAAAAVCPFDCYVHVHKDEVTRIETMLVDYQKTRGPGSCAYNCIQYPGVDCVSGKCELRQP